MLSEQSYHNIRLRLDAASNDERSDVEVYEFLTNKPLRYTAYVDHYHTITTWTGQKLGTITHAGKVYRSNFGDKRQHLTIKALNGLTYSATAYLTAGDYCHMRAVKVKV